MNRFLYKYIKWAYLILSTIRMIYYINIGKKEKAKNIITEHIKW